MITAEQYFRIVDALGQQACDDIHWATHDCKRPATADEMACEIIYVICNSGMKNTIARLIYGRVRDAIEAGRPVLSAFKHPSKAAAIEGAWKNRAMLFDELQEMKTDSALLGWCACLPWIGEITKYHLAKNFGADVAKPDVHLQRLADREKVSVQALCERLAVQTGSCVRAVDTVLWRACANGVINSRTGEIRC